MLQSQFAEFLQLHSSIALVYSTYPLVSDLIRSAEQLQIRQDIQNYTPKN